MPTSVHRGALSNRSPIGFSLPASYRPSDVLIGTWSWCAIGDELTGSGASNFIDTVWVGANTAYAYPFEIADYYLVQKVWWVNASDATGPHVDVGVYTEGGTRLVSSGDVTQATINVVQEFDVTDTLLAPGRYWCAMASSTTTGSMLAAATPIAILRAAGCAQMSTAFTLPSTFTPAAISSAFMPLFGIAARTQVA